MIPTAFQYEPAERSQKRKSKTTAYTPRPSKHHLTSNGLLKFLHLCHIEYCVEILFRGVVEEGQTTADEELQGDMFLVNPHGQRTLVIGKEILFGWLLLLEMDEAVLPKFKDPPVTF